MIGHFRYKDTILAGASAHDDPESVQDQKGRKPTLEMRDGARQHRKAEDHKSKGRSIQVFKHRRDMTGFVFE